MRRCRASRRRSTGRPDARDGWRAGEGVICDDAERVDVVRRGGRMPARLLRREVLHRTHHLTGGRERHLIRDPSDAEVGDLDAPVGRDEQVAGLDVAVHEAGRVGYLQSGCGLRHDVEYAVGREHLLALEHRREGLPRHELHDEVGRAVFLSVVEDVGDALVVAEGGVPRLGAEALEEAGVAEVLVLEDLDGDGASDHEVGGLPHLPHAADRDPARQLVSPTEGEAARGSHLFSTASMTFFASGPAVPLPDPDCPLPAPSSSSTATATCGSSAGAKPVYQSVYGSFLPFCAVPDLPPTSTPSILAPLATPLATLATISWVIVAATS